MIPTSNFVHLFQTVFGFTHQNKEECEKLGVIWAKTLNILSPNHRTILELSYGLHDGRMWQPGEIAIRELSSEKLIRHMQYQIISTLMSWEFSMAFYRECVALKLRETTYLVRMHLIEVLAQRVEMLRPFHVALGLNDTEIPWSALSLRSQKAISSFTIETVGDLQMMSAEELLLTKSFGKKSLDEIRGFLSLFNANLRPD